MNNLQFIKKLYNGKNCYSDSLTEEEIALLHVASGVENIVKSMVAENRIVFLTGNPGDGKTYIIRALEVFLKARHIYLQTDMNSVTDENLQIVIEQISNCYHGNKSCVIAANEFPFFNLIRATKQIDIVLYNELIKAKRNVIMYGYPTVDLRRICIIDLNERNLLDKDRSIAPSISKKLVDLLVESKGINRVLDYNIAALQIEQVNTQLQRIFSLVAMCGEHFAIRDILGTMAYMLVSCTFDDDADDDRFYYDAFFSGENDLMSAAASFDPVLLSIPSLDEQLWSGKMVDGWLLGAPEKWPWELTENSVEDATTLFKSIKRKFYFENIYAKELSLLQPTDYIECERIFTSIKSTSEMKRTRSMIINSINRLFLSTDEEKERLRIWTTHSYDLSREAGAAVSAKYVDASDLELAYPEPVSWLKEMEYAPRFLVLKRKGHSIPKIELDIELLRGLISIKNGYPVSLLSGQYEQAISQFTQELSASPIAREYGDGEIQIANRRDSTYKRIFIDDNKYCFSDGGDY